MTCNHQWSAETHGGLLSRICHQCNLYELEVQVAELRELLDRTVADAWRAEIARVAEERDALRREIDEARAQIERLRDERRQLRRRLVECRPWVGVCPLEAAKIDEVCLVRDLADDTLKELVE